MPTPEPSIAIPFPHFGGPASQFPGIIITWSSNSKCLSSARDHSLIRLGFYFLVPVEVNAQEESGMVREIPFSSLKGNSLRCLLLKIFSHTLCSSYKGRQVPSHHGQNRMVVCFAIAVFESYNPTFLCSPGSISIPLFCVNH